MKAYTKIGGVRIFGAPVFVHWSVGVVALGLLVASGEHPALAIVGISSYFGVLLLHESGHAYFAKRQGSTPLSIKLSAVHGTCTEPYGAYEDYLIAWGGVIAQLAVAVPLVVLNATLGLGNIDPIGPVVGILGYVSIAIAAFNLIPAAGLDGARAWRLIPLLFNKRRANQFRPSRKKRGKLRILK